ncbi:rRNA (cytosine-C(5))-methyltransferase, putative [Plasmodium vinckei lentum]|uniref:rRNA (Cytosine-C(5))-methyltransferase, putative n=1 Tax=Plasmodium vinckei lentum TaxID=138297 RepID=A0A6V7RYN5_PLAVN|nr:rRNA (cytosine-C(5))-methyltransferase, putative [Plasmodium vinckei lentum]
MSFIYRKAAQMLMKCSKGDGIKDVLFKKEDQSIKKIYFIVHKSMEDLDIFNKIYNTHLSKICKNKYLGIVLLCVLIHRKKIDGGGELKREILKKEKEIFKLYNNLKNNNDVKINILTKYFIIYLNDNPNIVNEIKTLLPIENDEDVENLYKICTSKVKNLIDSIYYKNDKIRILDKSSGLVVKSANIQKGMTIVDVCSSPGSKAILSLLNLENKGYLICIEKSKTRCYTLIREILKNNEYIGYYTNENMSETDKINIDKKDLFINNENNIYYIKHKNNELIIKIYNCDFLKLTHKDFQEIGDIDVVFVDPSCSSSGMPDFVHKENMRKVFLQTKQIENDKNKQNEKDEKYNSYNIYSDISEERIPKVPNTLIDKIKNLSNFQKDILNHALVTIKTAKTFVYSTCSFFEEENEQVIKNVLEKNSEFSIENAGTDKFLFKNGKYEFSDKCVRTFPNRDNCRGIFICKMCRK